MQEMQENQVWPPSREDPLEEEMASHSSILAWNPMDIRAWWATVHMVTKSRIWLSEWARTHTQCFTCDRVITNGISPLDKTSAPRSTIQELVQLSVQWEQVLAPEQKTASLSSLFGLADFFFFSTVRLYQWRKPCVDLHVSASFSSHPDHLQNSSWSVTCLGATLWVTLL